jgi:uncharacterized protein (DUF2132 family)
MTDEQPHNPLHGVTLKAIMEYLLERHGWEELGELINIRCFHSEPSINSSLKFLRKTPWAREKVERLYVKDVAYAMMRRKRNKRRADMRTFAAAQIEPGTDTDTDTAAKKSES